MRDYCDKCAFSLDIATIVTHLRENHTPFFTVCVCVCKINNVHTVLQWICVNFVPKDPCLVCAKALSNMQFYCLQGHQLKNCNKSAFPK